MPSLFKKKSSEKESSSKNDQKEHQKRMKEMEDQLAAEKAKTEAIKAKQVEEKEKGKAEMERQAIERQIKSKEKEEKHQQISQQQKQERKMKADAAEEQHQQKLQEMEEQHLKDIQALEVEMKDFENKRQERRVKAEEDMLERREQSEAKIAEILQEEANLRNEMEKLKSKSVQESKEWGASFEALLKSVRNEYQQEIDNRRHQEEAQIETLKRINDEDDQKYKALTKSLGELKNVVAIKAKKMMYYNTDSKDSKPAVLPQQSIKIVENKHVGSSEIVIQNVDDQPSIGVIGLPKSGRSFLIGALAGGIWPKDLGTSNPVISKNGAIYKLNHPNNGFINGSVDENRPIYDEFFQTSALSKLSTLILTIHGAIQEEDYLVLCLAKQYSIPTVIVRTKLDEWLDNLPAGESKDEYVEKDKAMVLNSLQDLNFHFSKNHIFNVSALSMIIIADEGIKSEMMKYSQDEKALLKFLNEHGFEDCQQKKLVTPDILILGLKGSGKSAIAESLEQHFHLSKQGKSICEMEYDETMKINEMIQKVEDSKAALYILVVPNTVGRMDAELTKYLLNSNKNICVLLNKSDEIMDNLRKQQKFYGNEYYVQKRLEAAQLEFMKVDINYEILPCFSISAFALSGYLQNGYITHEQNFLDFVANALNLQV